MGRIVEKQNHWFCFFRVGLFFGGGSLFFVGSPRLQAPDPPVDINFLYVLTSMRTLSCKQLLRNYSSRGRDTSHPSVVHGAQGNPKKN